MSLRRWSVTLLTALVAVVTIAPLLWMVSVSFMVRGEAARIDGASEGQILRRIVLPILTPIIVTLAL